MGNIRLLDCTLRDGGYINDWDFGKNAIIDMTEKITDGCADYFEIGFLKDEKYDENRTVFNQIAQINRLIKQKKQNVEYMAMIEVVNPLPLEMIPECNEEGVDIIRIIIWKRLLKEGFEYCKGIVEKGYKISVQPARVDQYSEEEFIDMIKLFDEINPMAFYVVDSFGTQNAESLMKYFHLADKHLKKETAIGYHGHNNLMQAFDVACKFIELPMERDKIVDASIYGIGRGAGNLNLEVIAEYMNTHFGRNYNIPTMLYIYDWYLKEIYAKTPWGYSLPHYLTAIHNCNPNYANYYAFDFKTHCEDIEGVLTGLEEEDRIIFNEKRAFSLLKQYFIKKWKSKLAVIVPTTNREKDIEYYLDTVGESFAFFGIDLIIYDSSDDDKIEKIVKNYTINGNKFIIYKRYSGKFDGITIDEKVMSCYKEFVDDYEYLWAIRDGLLVNISACEHDIYKLICKDFDTIIVYSKEYDEKNIGYKEYSNCAELFKDSCQHMAILGSAIFSTRFLKRVLAEEELDKEKNYGLWQPIAMFYQYAKYGVHAANYVGAPFIVNKYSTPSSFWNKNGEALWQWGKRWYTMIDLLPSVYDPVKPEVMKIQMADFTPFGFKQLIIMRSNGSLSIKKLRGFKAYLEHVTETPLWKFKIASLMPKWVCIQTIKQNNILFSKVVKKSFKIAKYTFRKIYPQKIKYNLGESFIPDANNYVKLEEKKICVVIPTSGKFTIIKDVVLKTIKTYKDYNIDLIIFDSEKHQNIIDLIKELNEQGYENIYYDVTTTKFDGVSLDIKVIDIYKKYYNSYEYIWVIRDRSILNLNNCIYQLSKLLNVSADIISIHNYEDDYYGVRDKTYDDMGEFFKEQFVAMTVLGQTIIRSELIKDIVESAPLDAEKNYGLWQPIAFFEYFSEHKVKAYSCTDDIFQYHPEAQKGSFWMKNLMWQWVYRWYVMIDSLPSIYDKNKKSIIKEISIKYGLLSATYLLIARSRGGVSHKEVKNYKELIPYVTDTSYSTFQYISRCPKKLAKFICGHMDWKCWKDIFTQRDDLKFGKIAEDKDNE